MLFRLGTLIWIPFILGACDFLFPPCTTFKKEVCACDDAGAVLCEAAEAAEDKAQEFKEDEDENRYDSAQDACQTALDAWDEAKGCKQFKNAAEDTNDDETSEDNVEATGLGTDGGDAEDGGSTGGDATGGDATGGDATGGDATGGDATGGDATGGDATGGDATGGDATGSPAIDATVNCEADCLFEYYCAGGDEDLCMTNCLTNFEENDRCDGPGAADYKGCVEASVIDCNIEAYLGCSDAHLDAIVPCP